MNILKSIDRTLARLEGRLLCIFLWELVILTFIQVCLRGLYTHFHAQWANTIMGYMDWSEALVRLLVLWLAFLGASLLTGENKHIKIDLFSSLLPDTWLPLREAILSAICVMISAIMLRVSLGYITIEIKFGGTTFLDLPSWIGQLILPVGFALILFRFFLRTLDQGLDFARGTST